MSEDGEEHKTPEGRGRDIEPFAIPPGQPRRALNMLHRAIGQGWPVGQDTRDRAVPVLEGLAFSANTEDRTRLKAIDCLRLMAKDNVDAAIALDRIERLETGGATERVEFKPMEF